MAHPSPRRVAAKSPLGEALKYIARYWQGLSLLLTDGRIEIDNNGVERTIRPIALNRKNALFAGHDAEAQKWATIASLIKTCKLNGLDPQAYLTGTLTAIVNGHKQSRIASCRGNTPSTCDRNAAYTLADSVDGLYKAELIGRRGPSLGFEAVKAPAERG
jgi:hypothetical protein